MKRSSFLRRSFRVLLIVLVVLLAAFFFVVPAQVDRRMNATLRRPPYRASPQAQNLHRTLVVADLHADTLLWNRDLLEHGTRGHVDIPRLAEGNVTVQTFSVVTKMPKSANLNRNDASSDRITLLAVADRWPPSALTSLKARALYQAQKLRDTAERSGGKLVVLRSKSDLAQLLEGRKDGRTVVAGVLALEGAHALEGSVENLDALYDAGFRIIGLAHFFDNEFAGSAHGVSKYGLTEKGKLLVRRIQEKGMIVDLAHASPQAFDDVMTIATRPVVVSHTGVRGTCDNPRNLSDAQLQAIAKNGGLVGIGYWSVATCGSDARAIARAIRHAANVVGTKHVALGSDYDGGITAPFDASGLVLITEALLAQGFTEGEIADIMGGNVVRLLQSSLP